MALAIKPQEPSFGELDFRGLPIIADPDGCLFIPEQRTLVVSDLHFEKGSSFAARRSTFLPPYDTRETLARLGEALQRWQPQRIIALGDSFHDQTASERLDQFCHDQLSAMMQGREWIWVLGNHDPEPPANLGGDACSEFSLGPLNFIHEPKRDFSPGEIAGHLHPSARIIWRGKSLRRRCFAVDDNRIIMPAFGAFTGGLNVCDAAFDGLFSDPSFSVWMMGRGSVFRICGSRVKP